MENMTLKYLVGVAAIALVASFPALADEKKIIDPAACPALRDESAYGEKHENFMFLLTGKDGWLFRTKQDLRQEFEISKESMGLFKELNDALKSRGTDLVIAYAPTRGMAAKAYLPVGDSLAGDYNPDAAFKNYSDMIAAMNAEGIRVVGISDLTGGESFFYKTDHHWTTAGAKKMADELAAALQSMDSFRAIPKIEYDTTAGEPKSFEGSFKTVLNPLCGGSAPFDSDSFNQTSTTASADEGALFGDVAEPQIVLVGTSNSKKENNDVNFDGMLKDSLSADVYNAAISGGGMDDPMLAYLVSDLYRKNPPKILIWEIPGYYDMKGKGTRDLLRQAIPSVAGVCEDSYAMRTSQTLGAQKLALFNDVAGAGVKGEDSYIHLKFAEPVSKSFTMAIDYVGEEDGESIKFARAKSYPHDGIYYFAPKGRNGAAIESVSFKLPEKMVGLSVDARICASSEIPAAYRVIGEVQASSTTAKKSWFSKMFERFFKNKKDEQ